MTHMRAAVIEAHGGPEVLNVQEVPRPAAGPGQLLVRVHAAGVNPVDAQNRADGAWGGVRLPAILGSDASGVVAAVGAQVEGFAAGDEVFYFAPFRGGRPGTYAEFHAVDADLVARKPPQIGHKEAAALPLAAATALAVVEDRLAVRDGERILVHGASGGVGLYALQLARRRGAVVVGSASARRRELLAAHGVEHLVDYAQGDVSAQARALAGGTLDCVADLVGDLVPGVLGHMSEDGRLAGIVSLSGELDEALDRNLTIHGVLVRPGRAAMERIAVRVAEGALTPVVDRVYALEEIQDAHRRVDSGHGQGKVVVDLDAPAVGTPYR